MNILREALKEQVFCKAHQVSQDSPITKMFYRQLYDNSWHMTEKILSKRHLFVILHIHNLVRLLSHTN